MHYSDPMMPKKAPSPFILYAMNQREKLKSEKSTLSTKEMVKTFATQWKAMNQEQKQPFITESQRAKEKSMKARHDYLAKNPMPKSPPGPYMMFVKERSPSILSAHPEWLRNEKMKKLSEILTNDWKALSPVDKEKYTEKYRESRTSYMDDLKQWTKIQLDKLPGHIQPFARDAVESGHFKRPKEMKVIFDDLGRAVKKDEAAAKKEEAGAKTN